MSRKVLLFMIFILSILFISACGIHLENNEEYPYGHYEDDQMIGTVSDVYQSKSAIIVDISEWEKRDRKGPNMDDDGYDYQAKITDKTVIKYEKGNETSLADIKEGQKVLVHPPRGDSFEGEPDEIVLLEMTYEEKYSGLLSHTDGMNIVVMYMDNEMLPFEMQENLYENVLNILEGTKHTVTGAWKPYNENFIVDYQDELDIQQFPVMLVFDEDELIFKGYDVDELYDFFSDLAK